VGSAPPLATFTLGRLSRAAAARATLRVPLDRRALATVPGLRFARLLGCARGRAFGWRPDLRRWALVAAWDSADALERFERDSEVVRHLRDGAEESWTVRLEPRASRGTWDREAPFAPAPGAGRDEPDGPAVVLTRATLRARRLRAFRDAVPAVDEALGRADGLLASVGVGETPVRRQGTLSVWRSGEDVRRFAYGEPSHLDAIRRRRDERWYAEELFTRFRPVATRGTWDGVDPLAGLLPPAVPHDLGLD